MKIDENRTSTKKKRKKKKKKKNIKNNKTWYYISKNVLQVSLWVKKKKNLSILLMKNAMFVCLFSHAFLSLPTYRTKTWYKD